VIDCAIIS